MIRRPGYTLIETLVVLALLVVITGTIGATLVRQQQFYRGAGELIQARQGVRDASELLSADLRAISLADTVRLMTDSAMEFYSTIGASVLCIASDDVQLELPGSTRSRGNTLTSFATEPDTGDLALVLRESANAVTGSWWDRYRISSAASRASTGSCDAFGQSGSRAHFVTLRSPLTALARPGTPIRFLRRSRYSLYRSSDGLWYLGYRRCSAGAPPACSAIQPLSGPYRPYSRDPAATGILFEYFDASGAPMAGLDASPALARVAVTARAMSAQSLRSADRTRTFGDSSFVTVSIRNPLR